MADPFVIYTLGETGLFASALNGIAMLFNDSDLFSGSGIANVGFGAFFGFTILFTIWLYNAAFKQQMEMKSLLAPLVVYIILTVPKTTVILEDINTGAARNVDNIPIGLALPASAASGISLAFTRMIEQAYMVIGDNVDNDPISILDQGFITPLKLINGLRDASTITPSQSLLQTTKNIYQTCISTNPNFNVETYKRSENPVAYFAEIAKQSDKPVVYVTLAVQGTLTESLLTCEIAGDRLQKAMEAYLDGINGDNENGSNTVNKMIGDVTMYNLRNAVLRQMNANGDTSGFNLNPVQGGEDYTINDMINHVGMMSNTSQVNSRNFMMATIFNPMLESASYCYDRAENMSDMSKCSAWISSKSQWEEKNAASATGFIQILQNGQNVLLIFSFLIFPIMVLFIMFMGVGSFKIIGNYLAFTVAVYLWVPMASIINFYIQSSLVNEWMNVAMATGITELNLITGPQFYAAVSKKLALGNALMASVPVLCMMLFSGMMMGMNQIYSRMNSADAGNYDAKVNSPDIAKSAPLATNTSTVETSGSAITKIVGAPSGTLSSQDTQQTAREYSKSLSNDRSQIQSQIQALEASVGAKVVNGEAISTGTGRSEASGSGATIGDTTSSTVGVRSSDSVTDQSAVNLGTTAGNENSTAKGVTVQGGASGQGGGSGSMAKKPNEQANKNNANKVEEPKKTPNNRNAQVVTNGGGSIGGALVGAGSDKNSTGVALTESNQAILNNGSENNSTESKALNSSNMDSYSVSDFKQHLKLLEQHYSKTQGTGFSDQISEQFSKAEKMIDSMKQTEQQAVSFTQGLKMDESEIGHMIKLNPQKYNDFMSKIDPNDQEFQQLSKTNTPMSVRGEDAKAIANLKAAAASDNPTYNQAFRDYVGGTTSSKYNQMASNVNTGDLKPVGAKVDQAVSGVENRLQETQLRNNLEPKANNVPTDKQIKAPEATTKPDIKPIAKNEISVAPVDYKKQAEEANKVVVDENKNLIGAAPK